MVLRGRSGMRGIGTRIRRLITLSGGVISLALGARREMD
jgi:hypothetical protein